MTVLARFVFLASVCLIFDSAILKPVAPNAANRMTAAKILIISPRFESNIFILKDGRVLHDHCRHHESQLWRDNGESWSC